MSTLERSIQRKVLYRLYPKHSISSVYGTVKLHREGNPLRPIQTSYDSLVCNIEKFLVDLLETTKKHVIYAVDSVKTYKRTYKRLLMEKKYLTKRDTKL